MAVIQFRLKKLVKPLFFILAFASFFNSSNVLASLYPLNSQYVSGEVPSNQTGLEIGAYGSGNSFYIYRLFVSLSGITTGQARIYCSSGDLIVWASSLPVSSFNLDTLLLCDDSSTLLADTPVGATLVYNFNTLLGSDLAIYPDLASISTMSTSSIPLETFTFDFLQLILIFAFSYLTYRIFKS
mgnify:CR=1 FL=1